MDSASAWTSEVHLSDHGFDAVLRKSSFLMDLGKADMAVVLNTLYA